MSTRKQPEKQVIETPKGEVLLYKSDDGSVSLMSDLKTKRYG